LITFEDLDEVDDPLELFRLASEAVAERQALIVRLASIRARAVADLHARGSSYRELSALLGISAPRVGQLVNTASPRLGGDPDG
jgi:DNA-directed RNA polymerase specialized sigma24 family protein